MTIRRLILPIAALLFSLAPPAAAQLLELLPADLRPGLTPAERKVLQCAPEGEIADFRVGDTTRDNPANADKWDNTRTIRAEFLYWLCTDEKATKQVHSKGIQISGARIEGQLDLEGAELPKALWLDFSAIPQGVVLRSAKTRDLSFDSSHFGSILANRLKVDGSIFLQGTIAQGEISLPGAEIGGDLGCDGAAFENPRGVAFRAQRLRVQGALFLRRLTALKGRVDLLYAHVGMLVDDTTSWPKDGKLALDGFEYDAFAGDETFISAEARLRWIRLQPPRPFHPQPYEQLAAVFRRMGYETEAQKVLIAKQDDLREYGDLPFLTNCWKWLLKQTMYYGYRPWLALVYMAVLLLIGWGIFSRAARTGVLKPTGLMVVDPSGKDPFLSPFFYSLDVFLPIIDLHQENGWLPDPTKPSGRGFLGKPWGWWVRIYFWAHIALGWIFSALLVAALTGLVHTD